MQKFIAHNVYGTNEYGAAVTEVQPAGEPKEVYLASEVDTTLKRQASAAITGMNAAKAISSGQLREAHRLRAESSPEMLESERQANAILTERVADLELAAKANAQYSYEVREEFERRGERIAELEKYEHAVKEHNKQCQQRCGVGDQEGVACGYRPYFPRRCPHCPVHETIELMGS